MLEKEFIKYNEALALEKLGFDETCFGGYDKETEKLWIGNIEGAEQFNKDFYILAPTYSTAFRWFRDKHDLYQIINVFVWDYDKKQMAFSVLTYTNPLDTASKKFSDSKVYESYEEAELECLKQLIEIVNNK